MSKNKSPLRRPVTRFKVGEYYLMVSRRYDIDVEVARSYFDLSIFKLVKLESSSKGRKYFYDLRYADEFNKFRSAQRLQVEEYYFYRATAEEVRKCKELEKNRRCLLNANIIDKF